MPRACALGELTLEQVGDADGELDDLDAALDVALGVGDGLAVLLREQFGQLFYVGVDQLDELHHHPGPALRVPGAPLLLRFDRGLHGGVDVGGRGHQDLRLHFAGAGIHHVGGAGRRQVAATAVDEMRNLGGGHEKPLGGAVMQITWIS